MIKKYEPETVSATVREHLTVSGQTQKDLALSAGVTTSMVSQYMTGYRQPSPHWVDLVANALDLTPEQRADLHRKAARENGFKIDLDLTKP